MSSMIYFYKGEEKYLTNAKMQRLITETKVDEFNITTYDCSTVNVEKAIFDALTPPFFGDKKIVIIKNPLFLESEKAQSNHNINIFIKYLENPMDDTYLLINASGLKINEKLEVCKTLNKCANQINTNGISEVEYSGWLLRECEIQGVRIDKNAIGLFYKASNANLEQSKNEIDKIINFVGKNGLITESIARELISKNALNDVYSLTNIIFESNKEKAFKVYKELTCYEKDVTVLINLITKSMKDSLLVKMMIEEGLDQNEIASKMKVTTSRCYYMIKNVKNISLDKIKVYINRLAKLDLLIKTGQIDKQIGFEEFLLNL